MTPLFKRLDGVRYLSTKTSVRMFTGVVEAIYGDRAIVKHESEPRYVAVPIDRLIKLGSYQ